jgi:hypothetical protein
METETGQGEQAMRKRIKQYGACLPLALLVGLLSGCASGGNQYYVSITESDAGSVTPTITNTPSKTVDTSMGVSAAATAAASQQGDASNAGAADAQAIGGQP